MRMMKALHKKLMAEILMVTAKIQREFPEQYKVLSETPLFLFDKEKEINAADFEHYLDSLKTQLAAFKEAE